MDNLSEENIVKFLMAFDEKSINNAEFSQYGNEVLFRLLKEQSEITLKVLSYYPNEMLIYILREIERPVHEDTDLIGIYNNISSIQNYLSAKQQILSSLKIAMDINNL